MNEPRSRKCLNHQRADRLRRRAFATVKSEWHEYIQEKLDALVANAHNMQAAFGTMQACPSADTLNDIFEDLALEHLVYTWPTHAAGWQRHRWQVMVDDGWKECILLIFPALERWNTVTINGCTTTEITYVRGRDY